MTRWFRFYTGVVDDPKAQMLAPDLFKHWVNLLCIAAENDGELPVLSATAFKLRLPEAKAAGILAKLCSFGLLDKTEKGFKPHNWDSRQYKSDVTDETAAERMRRYRDRKRNNRNATVTVTVPREQITDTETEKKETRVTALDDWPSDFREQFWSGYPHKIGKADAIAKLERVRKRGVSWAVLMDGLRRYITSKPADRPWCNPATWLNQARWEDQPAGSVTETVDDAVIDWDDQIARYKRGLHWSCKWFGPEPGMAGCRVPVDILAKHGYLNEPQDVPPIHINSMQ